MTEVQSDQFGTPRRVRVQSAAKRSLAGVSALVLSLGVMVPGLPLFASAWGWVVQRRESATPGGSGRGLAWAAVCIGLVMTAVQFAGFATGWRSWDRAQHGLTDALAGGDGLVAAFDPEVGEALDPRLVSGYERMLDHRYGALVEATCESSVAGVPLLAGDGPVTYTLKFEKATLQADIELVPAELGSDTDTWAKVRQVVIHDPQVGEIPFPPPPGWRPQRPAASAPATAIAEVPTP